MTTLLNLNNSDNINDNGISISDNLKILKGFIKSELLFLKPYIWNQSFNDVKTTAEYSPISIIQSPYFSRPRCNSDPNYYFNIDNGKITIKNRLPNPIILKIKSSATFYPNSPIYVQHTISVTRNGSPLDLGQSNSTSNYYGESEPGTIGSNVEVIYYPLPGDIIEVIGSGSADMRISKNQLTLELINVF